MRLEPMIAQILNLPPCLKGGFQPSVAHSTDNKKRSPHSAAISRTNERAQRPAVSFRWIALRIAATAARMLFRPPDKPGTPPVVFGTVPFRQPCFGGSIRGRLLMARRTSIVPYILARSMGIVKQKKGDFMRFFRIIPCPRTHRAACSWLRGATAFPPVCSRFRCGG